MRLLLRILFLLALCWLLWLMFGPGFRPAPDSAPDAALPETAAPPPARPARPWPPTRPAPDLSRPIEGNIDRILIEKGARRLSVYQDGQLVRQYRIALGFAPMGDKDRQGDGRTPEGLFKVDRRNDQSQYHLSLGIDYPQPEDRARARTGSYDPGGDIFIHGQPNQIEEGFRVRGDWTAGCIAIDNHQIDELFAATPVGTEVEIRP
ncbi:MAG: murein L,D-transpeptidase family protein [Paracoccus sp. (in: a-proteobacteria)]